MEEYKYDIFISYSQKDKIQADEICAILDQYGITYFIDRSRIHGGQGITDEIIDAITRSKVFLFLGSKSSYDSIYTKDEIYYVKYTLGRSTIIPYLLDDSVMPNAFRFCLGNTLWRTKKTHSFDPTVIEDIKLKLAEVNASGNNVKQPGERPSPVVPLVNTNGLTPRLKKLVTKNAFPIGIGAAVLLGIVLINNVIESEQVFEATRTIALDRDVTMKLILIEGHGDPYYMGQTTVTYQQWYAVMQDSLSSEAQANLPKTWVYWDDCLLYAAQLSEKTGLCFSLPTIEEWSYAAKADNQTRLCGSDNLNDVAWYSQNSDAHAHPVGQKRPNAWGLYDMLGNVWEFCSDSIQNYNNLRTKGHRVCGGGFETSAQFCLPDGEGLNRYNDFTRKIANKSPYHGFRLKMEPARKDFKQFADSLRNVVRERKRIQ